MRHQTSRLPVCCLLLTVAGCFPAELDEVTKRCSDERHCRAGLICSDGRCVPPGSLPNLLVNADFEDGQPPTGWTANRGVLSREVTEVKSGESAARVADVLFPSLQPLTAPVASSTAGATYCAYAWFRGSGEPAFLQILEGDEALRPEGGTHTGGEWVRLRASKTAQGGLPLTVQVWVGTGNAAFVVDAAALWLSTSGSCSET